MNKPIETEIAEATRRYVAQEWRLDVSTFGRTQNRAWLRLAGRMLDRPGATMPVKGLQVPARHIIIQHWSSPTRPTDIGCVAESFFSDTTLMLRQGQRAGVDLG